MIDARELRLRNLLSYNDNVVEVSNIGSNGFETTKDGVLYGSRDLSCYEPIPLTEQWLIDFEFEKENQYVVGVGAYSKMVKGELVLLLNNEGHYYTVTCPFKPVLKAVHHLQNLYFELSKEELTKK